MTAERIETRALTIDGPAGRLEAIMEQVPTLRQRFVSIVCHPHPQQAGTMQNKVVTTVSRALARHGGTALRFNYRGVGKSQGSYDGSRGELDDTLAALGRLRADCGASLPVVIAGFSFGGAIAYRAAAETTAADLITIAPALERIPAGVTAAPRAWLLVQGDDDDVIPAAGVLEWALSHNRRPDIVQFAETGHFFHGRLPQLTAAIARHLETTGI